MFSVQVNKRDLLYVSIVNSLSVVYISSVLLGIFIFITSHIDKRVDMLDMHHISHVLLILYCWPWVTYPPSRQFIRAESALDLILDD